MLTPVSETTSRGSGSDEPLTRRSWWRDPTRVVASTPARGAPITARGNRTPTARAKAASHPLRPERFVDAGAAPRSCLTTTAVAVPAMAWWLAALRRAAAARDGGRRSPWGPGLRTQALTTASPQMRQCDANKQQSGLPVLSKLGFCVRAELCRHVRLLLLHSRMMPSRTHP